MDLQQKQSISQTMRQEQTMTHQQIQALEMLFLPALELEAMIDAELEKNPVLETEGEPDKDIPDASSDEWLDQIMKLDEDSRYIRSKGRTAPSPDEEERRRHYLESVTEEQTLQQFLLDQLRFLNLEAELHECCEVVISGLNDDGYLTSHPADLAMASSKSLELVTQSISVIQQLDPPGVGAANLQERLLLELERKGLEDTKVYELVEDHLDDIASNHLPQVAKEMQVSMDELKDLIAQVKSLNPRLAVESVSPHEYIHEEVTIVEDSGELAVKLNNEYLPNLYISPQYRQLLSSPVADKETKDYVKEKLRSGVFLINSIIQRQSTIRKIMNQVVEIQKDFFISGMDHLKPMTMAQVADQIGIHETTVSRAVAGKYLRCKYGLLPIRHFFSTGYSTEDGDAVSKNVVKNAIRRLIDDEDTRKPLSDSKIAKMLKDDGYNVARRTVAKYRESMNILPSNLRREY